MLNCPESLGGTRSCARVAALITLVLSVAVSRGAVFGDSADSDGPRISGFSAVSFGIDRCGYTLEMCKLQGVWPKAHLGIGIALATTYSGYKALPRLLDIHGTWMQAPIYIGDYGAFLMPTLYVIPVYWHVSHDKDLGLPVLYGCADLIGALLDLKRTLRGRPLPYSEFGIEATPLMLVSVKAFYRQVCFPPSIDQGTDNFGGWYTTWFLGYRESTVGVGIKFYLGIDGTALRTRSPR
jgi:hypothetical protein